MNKKWYTDVLMLNRDPNWYRWADYSDKEACRRYFEEFFSMYGDCVTDICFCVFEQTALPVVTMVSNLSFRNWALRHFLGSKLG